jgi:manganese transport protein
LHCTNVEVLWNPNIEAKKESILKFLLYIGPAATVSVVYTDPGNYGTGIQGVALFNYNLLWVIWFSSEMAIILQYLSGKIVISTDNL